MFGPCRIQGSRGLHERKAATWALLIGETHSSTMHAETRRRPHRGMLPDVDFSRAVLAPGRPSLVRRIFGLLRQDGPRDRAKDTAPPASGDALVGEMPAAAYNTPEMAAGQDDSYGADAFDAVWDRAA